MTWSDMYRLVDSQRRRGSDCVLPENFFFSSSQEIWGEEEDSFRLGTGFFPSIYLTPPLAFYA